MATNHEKYLAGEPLNDELAALKRGELVDMHHWLSGKITLDARPPLTDPHRELTGPERAALREMRQGDGWPVLQRLLEKCMLEHTKAACQISEEDPLGKSDELARMWLTVKLWKRLMAELNHVIEAETKQPEDGDGGTENESGVKRA